MAIFGIVFAAVVYFAIGERQSSATAARPTRLDPRAILESIGSKVQQLRLAKQDFVIEADRQLTYEDGSTKLMGVRIRVPERQGRTFLISGREASSGPDQKLLQLTGDVKLASNDGFEVSAESATFDDSNGTVAAPGPVSFQKGRMSGSGVGMSYDNNNDVLSLTDMAHVVVKNDADEVTAEFTSGVATLARRENTLTLERSVHALRGEQVIEADKVTASLTENEERITFMELRGNARVVGGGAFDSMSAGDIDLDYADDGQALERVVLTGKGAIAMKGENGAAGRQFLGETLDLAFAPDATLTRAIGRQNVRVDLPGAPNTPARKVTASAFDADGEPVKGLTSARFTENVEYREEGAKGAMPRVARSRALAVTLAQDAISSALFNGSVKFDEQGLQASGAQAAYDPVKGTLKLSGVDAGGGPRVADTQINIEADAIDIALQGRSMQATGNVKTTLRPRTAAAARKGTAANDGRLPGLLQEGQPANVNGNALVYEGAAGKAVYTGKAALWQGETAIRGDVITIDQTSGDLVATGTLVDRASSTVILDTTPSIGRAIEIRYEDATRKITYDTPVPVAVAPVVPVVPAAPVAVAPALGAPPAVTGVPGMPAPVVPAPIVVPPAAQSQLSGPQGDVRADRIEVILAKGESKAERLEAYTNVNVRVDTRIATAARLTYFSDEGRYLLSGAQTVGVQVVDGCRETRGKTLTFFKASDRIIVDGLDELRTQTKSSGPCAPPPAAR